MGAVRASVAAAAVVAGVVLAFPAAAGPTLASQARGEVAIFYYAWYSNPARDGHWAHWYAHRNERHVLSTPFYPRRGLYSSSSPRILDEHMREIRAAGVTTVVVSWWGHGSREAERLPLVTEVARRHGLRVAIHLEPYEGRTPARAVADMETLRAHGYTDFYVYEAARDAAGEWAEALTALRGVRVFGHTTFAGRAKASGFHGLYTYDVLTWRGSMFARLCKQARRLGLLCAPSVGPGFDARLVSDQTAVRDRDRGRTYDGMWRSAIRAGADLVTITSYNEWQEGTQIEPARPQVGRPAYGGAWVRRGAHAQRAYLDATARWAAGYRAAIGQ
jgi:glycoprotein endo-alpha-1,2-mannosidase